jgi:Mor family transcriptional regulator
MGERFLAEKFRATVNPYGVMYNPASILHTVSRCESSADFAVLTLGTNHVYRLKETDEIVDNCQKRPQSLFREEVLSIDECVGFLSQAVDTLVKRNPDIKVIITVSPIRYAKYGFHESQLSKAVLLLSANEMEKRYAGKVFYFPAYEIVNDELRDYRFYASDMLHPSEQAVEYIWECFSVSLFGADTLQFLKEWQPIREAINHRPFNPDSEAYKEFVNNTLVKVRALKQKYTDLELEDNPFRPSEK